MELPVEDKPAQDSETGIARDGGGHSGRVQVWTVQRSGKQVVIYLGRQGPKIEGSTRDVSNFFWKHISTSKIDEGIIPSNRDKYMTKEELERKEFEKDFTIDDKTLAERYKSPQFREKKALDRQDKRALSTTVKANPFDESQLDRKGKEWVKRAKNVQESIAAKWENQLQSKGFHFKNFHKKGNETRMSLREKYGSLGSTEANGNAVIDLSIIDENTLIEIIATTLMSDFNIESITTSGPAGNAVSILKFDCECVLETLRGKGVTRRLNYFAIKSDCFIQDEKVIFDVFHCEFTEMKGKTRHQDL
ncbi:MAG: hypothetical protein AAFN27_13535 [Pseudomonadota bacterium]